MTVSLGSCQVWPLSVKDLRVETPSIQGTIQVQGGRAMAGHWATPAGVAAGHQHLQVGLQLGGVLQDPALGQGWLR